MVFLNHEIPYGICTETRSPGRHRELSGGQGAPTVPRKLPQSRQTSPRVARSDQRWRGAATDPPPAVLGPVCKTMHCTRFRTGFAPKLAAQDVTGSFSAGRAAPRCYRNVPRPTKLTHVSPEVTQRCCVAATDPPPVLPARSAFYDIPYGICTGLCRNPQPRTSQGALRRSARLHGAAATSLDQPN